MSNQTPKQPCAKCSKETSIFQLEQPFNMWGSFNGTVCKECFPIVMRELNAKGQEYITINMICKRFHIGYLRVHVLMDTKQIRYRYNLKRLYVNYKDVEQYIADKSIKSSNSKSIKETNNTDL